MKKSLILTLFLLIITTSAVSAQNNQNIYSDNRTPSLFNRVVNLMRGNNLNQSIRVNYQVSAERLELNRLLMEHNILAITHMQYVYEGINAARSRQLLEENANQLATLYVNTSTNYNNNRADNRYHFNRDEFLRVWREHLNYYEQYALSYRENNNANRDNARNRLSDLSRKFGSLFDTENEVPVPNEQDSDDIAWKLMNDHTTATLNTFDAYAAGNYDEYANRLAAGSRHSQQYADQIAALFEGQNSIRSQ